MAEIDQLLRIFTELANKMQGQSSVLEKSMEQMRLAQTRPAGHTGPSPKEKAAAARQDKTLGAIDQSYKRFKDAVGSLSSLDEVPAHLSKALAQSNTQFARMMGTNVSTLADVYRVEDQIYALNELTAASKSLKMGEISAKDYLNVLSERVKKAGVDVEQFGFKTGDFAKFAFATEKVAKGKKLKDKELKHLNKTNKSFQSLENATSDLTYAVEDSAKSMEKTTKPSPVWNMLKGVFGKLATAAVPVGYLAKEAINAAGAAQKFGTEMSLADATMLGLTSEAFSELQGKIKQSTLAMGGMSVTTNLLRSNSMSMVKLMGELGGGTQVAADFIQNLRMMGDSSIDMQKEFDSEVKMAEKFRNNMGMTGDQFAALTRDLLQDSDIRFQLMKTKESERKQVLDGMRTRMLEFHAQGLNIEQMKAATKAMASLAAETPIERMKKAAKTQAMLGAVGMGAQAGQAAQIMRKGQFATKEEQDRLAQIMATGSEKIMQTMGEGLGQEIYVSTMLAKTGLEPLFGKESALAQATLGKGLQYDPAFAKAQADLTQATGDMGRLLSEKLGLNIESQDNLAVAIAGLEKATVGITSPLQGLAAMAELATGGGNLSNTQLATMGIVAGGTAYAGSKAITGIVSKVVGEMMGSSTEPSTPTKRPGRPGQLTKYGKLAGKLAGPAGAAGSALMVGKDLYDVIAGEAKAEDWGGVIGGALGGLAGAIGGPIGVAIGAGVGNTAGEWIGSFFNEQETEVKNQAVKNAKILKQPQISAVTPDVASRLDETKDAIHADTAQTTTVLSDLNRNVTVLQDQIGTLIDVNQKHLSLAEGVAQTESHLMDEQNRLIKKSQKPGLSR